jgi:hypothetical protein
VNCNQLHLFDMVKLHLLLRDKNVHLYRRIDYCTKFDFTESIPIEISLKISKVNHVVKPTTGTHKIVAELMCKKAFRDFRIIIHKAILYYLMVYSKLS